MNFFRLFSTRSRKRLARPHSTRLEVECLEDRLAPATHIWTGAVSNLWSNGDNWIGGSPAGDAQAVLSFQNAGSFANQNDLAGLSVSAIDFAVGSYALSGNAITLVHGPSGAPRVHMDAPGISNTIAFDLRRLESNVGIIIDVADGSTLTLTGVISGGSAATSVVKEGAGKLVLSAANTFADSVLINAGKLHINNAAALGTADVGTRVMNGAVLELHGFITVSAEPLVLEQASLRNVNSNNVWQGPVTLVNSPAIDVLADTLTISGVIGGNTDLTVFSDPPAKLILTEANTYTGATFILGLLNIRNPLALGQPGGLSTFVGDGGALELELQGTSSINEGLRLARTGVGGNGALRNLSGANTWTGTVVLETSNVNIGVSGGQLTISAPIAQPSTTSLFGITKVGDGALFLTANSTYTGGTNILAGSLFVNGTLQSRVRLSAGRLGGTGTVKAITTSGGVVNAGIGVGRLTISSDGLNQPASFGLASVFEVDLNGTTAGVGYDQLRVTGSAYDTAVALGASTLIARLNFFPSSLTSFTIIDNATASRTSGTFAGLPEGAIIQTSRGSLQITYKGGTGNDVVLHMVNTSSRFPDRSVTPVIDEGGLVTLTGTISDPDPHDVFFLDVNWGDGTPTEHHVFPPGSDGTQVQLTHRYRDDTPSGTPENIYTIQLAWHDKAGEGNSATLTTTVRNVAPVVNADNVVQLRPSGVLTQLVTFTDPGHDRWTVTVDFGDGSDQQTFVVRGRSQFLLQHRYTQAGAYIVKMTVTDDGGEGTATFEVRALARPNTAALDASFSLLAADDDNALRLGTRRRF
jgi:autotransporter-associated beta strand protein